MRDKKKIIKNDINVDKIPKETFLEYYGSTLNDMFQFGSCPFREIEEDFFPRLEVYLEIARKPTTLNFYQDLFDCIKSIIHTDKYFLISKDSDGVVYLLMYYVTKDVTKMITILSEKHIMDFGIHRCDVGLSLIQIRFYIKKYPAS